MSEAEAYLRIEVARLTTRYPAILHKLAGGQLHLTAIKLVAHLLTQDNHRRLLEAVSDKSKAQVLERDSMRCTFVSDDAKRCEEQGMLEFHHDEAHARGGACTTKNIKLMCRAHNRLLAERDFGPLFMALRVQEARSGELRLERHQP